VTVSSTQYILHLFAQPLLRRNEQFKNLHKGQSCYVFGNGASLKGMDLSCFSDRVSIGCNSLFVHQEFKKLDCRYYFLPAAFLFHRYRKYYGYWQRNYMGDLFQEKILSHTSVSFFTSLSNWVGLRANNLFFAHHFGYRGWDFGRANLDGYFSFMQGGIYAMIGLAYWMGFKSITLVGCDYAFSPRYSSHFFEKGTGQELQYKNVPYGGDFFLECAKVMDISIILPDGVSSKLMSNIEYSAHTGQPFGYRENTDIVSGHDLAFFAKQGSYNV